MALHSRIPRCPSWLALLGPIIGLLYGGGFVVYLLTRWPTIMVDAAFFQHLGWYVLQGGIPYIDAWDVNPPVPFAITAVLALLAGGDMLILHGLSVVLTTLTAAVSVVLVAWVAFLITGEDTAAVAAGLTMLIVPEFIVLPFAGVLAQVYALLFGLLALVLVLHDRPMLAGFLAALSAGSWQLGGVFALLVVGIIVQQRGWTGARSAMAGGGIVLGCFVLVFAAADALVAMVVQTVLAPLVAGEPASLVHRVVEILLAFGYGSLVLPVAVYGWLHAAVVEPRDRWWVPAGATLLVLQVLFLDMDGSTDMFLWLAFVALGVAITVDNAITLKAGWQDHQSRRESWTVGRRIAAITAVGMLVSLIVASGLAWNYGTPPPKATLETVEQEAEPAAPPQVTPADGDVPTMRTIYWEQREPEACHYRLSWNEARWISQTDDHLDERLCGGWPERINHSER